MLRRTEGIVLKTFPYGEADLLVTFLTPDHGLRKVFAKSPRKTKSRFGSALEPFTCAKISFMGREEASLPRLTQADIIRPFQGLREDMACFLRVSGMAELTLNFLHEGVRSEEAYRLLRRVLELMEQGCGALYALLYTIRFLALKGYRPGLAGCGRCGREARTFHPSQGSVMCSACEGRAGLRPEGEGVTTISPGSGRLYEALGAWDLEKITRLKASPAMVEELQAVLNTHVEYLLSRPLKTRSFTSGLARSS